MVASHKALQVSESKQVVLQYSRNSDSSEMSREKEGCHVLAMSISTTLWYGVFEDEQDRKKLTLLLKGASPCFEAFYVYGYTHFKLAVDWGERLSFIFSQAGEHNEDC